MVSLQYRDFAADYLGWLLRRGTAPKTRICSGVVLTLLLGLLILPSAASATVLPGKITENMTLTAAGNPYRGSTVTVESGATLKVEPGVKILINSLNVYGTLDVDGTAEESVIFTSSAEKEVGEWNQIAFESGSSASVIDHTEIKYGGGGNIGAISGRAACRATAPPDAASAPLRSPS